MSEDVVEKLSELRALRDGGSITEEEFAAAKAMLLAGRDAADPALPLNEATWPDPSPWPGPPDSSRWTDPPESSRWPGPSSAAPSWPGRAPETSRWPNGAPWPSPPNAGVPGNATPRGTAAPPWSGTPQPPRAGLPAALGDPRHRWFVVIAGVAVVVLLVAGGVPLVKASAGESGAAPGPVPPTASSPTGTPGAGSSSAGTVLDNVEATDRAAVSAVVGTWVPQLSSKREGMAVDGRRLDAGLILADHQQWRYRHPDALLLWSGDYSSYRPDDFWVTIVGRPFGWAAAANSWCASAGLGGDDCYAKYISHTVGPDGASAPR